MVQRMLPSSKGPGEHPRGRRARPPRHSCQVLAERNLSVVPVGVWVESGPGKLEESLACASASRLEEELQEQQRQKAARLRRFQGEVKQRVKQQLQLRRKQQLQQSYGAAERQSSVATQHSGSALRVTARKDSCLFQSHPAPLISAPAAHTRLAQHQGRLQSEPFQQQAAETPESCETPAEDEGEELQLPGHHHPPAELQEQGTALPGAKPDNDFYIKIEFKKSCGGSVQDSSSAQPPQRPHTHHHTPPVLWAAVNQEETKKQRPREQLQLRHLLMGTEWQQVREQQRQQERQRRMDQIKSKKENQRQVEEQKVLEVAEQRELSPGEGASETLAQLQLEERRVEDREKQQHHKKSVRCLSCVTLPCPHCAPVAPASGTPTWIPVPTAASSTRTTTVGAALSLPLPVQGESRPEEVFPWS